MVADKKFAQFARGLNLIKSKSIRAMIFASFIGIDNINEGDIEFYLKGLYYISNGR